MLTISTPVKKISQIHLNIFPGRGNYFYFSVCAAGTPSSSILPGRSRCAAAAVPGTALLKRGANFKRLHNNHPLSRVLSLAYLCITTLENFGFANEIYKYSIITYLQFPVKSILSTENYGNWNPLHRSTYRVSQERNQNVSSLLIEG